MVSIYINIQYIVHHAKLVHQSYEDEIQYTTGFNVAFYKYHLPGKYKYSYLMHEAFFYNSLKIVVIKQHYVKLMYFPHVRTTEVFSKFAQRMKFVIKFG